MTSISKAEYAILAAAAYRKDPPLAGDVANPRGWTEVVAGPAVPAPTVSITKFSPRATSWSSRSAAPTTGGQMAGTTSLALRGGLRIRST